MKIHRIYAVFLKNFYVLRRTIDRKTELFYWPAIDLILWGITSMYFKELAPENTTIVVAIISGLILWYFLWQAQNEVTINFLTELWYDNLVNIFATPLKFWEYIFTYMLSSIAKSIVMFIFTSVLALLLYEIGILPIGMWIIPFSLSLLITGWIYAFVITGFLLRNGTRVQSISWTLVFMLSPFSAVYYPLSLLPDWAQTIGKALPTSYIFESMRSLLNTNTFQTSDLLVSYGLNFVYLILAAYWLDLSYKYALKQGLVKLK